MPTYTVKLTVHPAAGGAPRKYVVNQPRSGMRPRVYTSLEKALDKVRELAA